jgi:hypothetical protein
LKLVQNRTGKAGCGNADSWLTLLSVPKPAGKEKSRQTALKLSAGFFY